MQARASNWLGQALAASLTGRSTGTSMLRITSGVRLSMNQVMLGCETDTELLTKLRLAVEALGGSIGDAQWTLGGSQEIITYSISLPGGSIEAVAETYVGLFLQGNPNLVSLLATKVVSA